MTARPVPPKAVQGDTTTLTTEPPTVTYVEMPWTESFAPSPARKDYLDGRDKSDAARAASLATPSRAASGTYDNRQLDLLGSSTAPAPASQVMADVETAAPVTAQVQTQAHAQAGASGAPPDEPPVANGPDSLAGANDPDEAPDANDLSRNWARVAGQGPTQVERIAQRDALARQALTDALIELLNNRVTTAPLAIGLFGEWGSGKSSQIGFVKQALARPSKGKPTIRVVEFNAWEHEKCDNLSAAMAQTVVENLIRGCGLRDQFRLARKLAAKRRAAFNDALAVDSGAFIQRMHAFAMKFVPFLSMYMAVAVALVALIVQTDLSWWAKTISSATVLVTGFWKTVSKFVGTNLTAWFKRLAAGGTAGPFGLPDFTSKLGSFHEIRTTLQHFTELQLEGCSDCEEDKYLLIVVDDLDRCSVGTIKLVLDAVRLVTSLDRVVTLVAVDDRIAFPAVESFFEQFKGSARDPSMVARDYLAKVFQVSISLPQITTKMARSFIVQELFREDAQADSPKSGADVQAGTADASPQTAPAPVPDDIALVTQDEVTLFAELSSQIEMNNPRALRRMKQAWLLLRKMVLYFDDVDGSYEPWMRSLFVREAIRSLSPGLRREIGGWADAARYGPPTIDLPAGVPSALGKLLHDDVSGISKRWSYADIVLLPVAATTGESPPQMSSGSNAAASVN
jgi:hypothetical protein